MTLPSAVISTLAAVARGDSRVTSTGKRSPLNTCPGKPTDSSSRPGLGRGPPERHGVDGDAELLRLPDGARHAAQILVAVGNQQQARHHAGGQRGRAVADGRFQIGAVARRARGVAQLPAVFGAFRGGGVRAWRGRRESRASSGVRARSPPGRPAPIRSSDPASDTLAEVSASRATATRLS